MALTGNNGCGKSTLMRIIAGDLSATTGTVSHPEHLYYVPQQFGQYDDRTIAPVSYTHLDVYKRQVSTLCKSSFKIGVPTSTLSPPFLYISTIRVLIGELIISSKAVSYTHLLNQSRQIEVRFHNHGRILSLFIITGRLWLQGTESNKTKAAEQMTMGNF